MDLEEPAAHPGASPGRHVTPRAFLSLNCALGLPVCNPCEQSTLVPTEVQGCYWDLTAQAPSHGDQTGGLTTAVVPRDAQRLMCQESAPVGLGGSRWPVD